MKKILLIGLVVLIFANLAQATLYDPQSGTGLNIPFGYDTTNYDFGFETFNASDNYYFNQSETWISKDGAPVGVISASIWNVNSSNQPTTRIAISTNTISGASVTGAFVPYNFTFSPVLLSKNTRYAIVLNQSGVKDATNFFRWEYGNTGNNTVGVNSTTANGWTSIDTSATGHFNIYGNTANFSITAADQYDSIALTNFSAIINNIWNYSTLNSTITTNISLNSSLLYNITVLSTQSGGYFNKTYLNYNFSNNLAATLFQSELRLNATKKVSGALITIGNFSASLQTVPVNSSLFLRANPYNVTYSSANAYNKTASFSVNALQNTTGTISNVYDTILNITAFNLSTGTYISNFNITIANITYSFSENGTSINGNATFNLTQGITYNITFNNSGYEYKSVLYTPNNISSSYNFNVYTAQSFNFTFRNEKTNAIIDNTNITVEFLSAVASYNYSTSNGKLYVDLITPSTYTIRYYANGYGLLRSIITEVGQNTYQNQTLYMIPSTNSTQTTFTVFDQVTLNKISDAIITIKRYYLPTNSYRTVDVISTNADGKAVADLELNNELYMFQVDYPYGTIKTTTGGQYINTNTLNLYISLTTSVTEDYYDENEIDATVSFNNNTGIFTVNYNDVNSVATNHCFTVKKYGQYGNSIINSTCTTSSSGTVNLGGVQTNSTNYLVYTATIGGQTKIITTAWVYIPASQLDAGKQGLFWALVIFVIFIFMVQITYIALIIGPLGLVYAKYLGLLTMEWQFVILIAVAGIILSIIIKYEFQPK